MRATGRAVLGLRGECGIVVRSWARFCAGLWTIEGIKKVAACLRGCQFTGGLGEGQLRLPNAYPVLIFRVFHVGV